jgi:hypothetical protein
MQDVERRQRGCAKRNKKKGETDVSIKSVKDFAGE